MGREFLGLPATFGAVGQVYPRSRFRGRLGAISGIQRAFKLCAYPTFDGGHELASEGFPRASGFLCYASQDEQSI